MRSTFWLATISLVLATGCGGKGSGDGTGGAATGDSAMPAMAAPDTSSGMAQADSARASGGSAAKASDTGAAAPKAAAPKAAAPKVATRKSVTRRPAAPKPATPTASDSADTASGSTSGAASASAASGSASGASNTGGSSTSEVRDAYHQAALDTVAPAVYQGWKQFNLNCARCHGEDVNGTTIAPHLIVSLRPDGPINTKALFTQTVCAGRVPKGMPAWCALGMEMSTIDNIYQYVKGRSDGKIHPGRPAQKSG